MLTTLNKTTPPASVDWRAIGKVSPVKNQANCGSCWAFSTVGSLEALNLINNSATNSSSNFSEQELVDCNTDNNGCGGGDPGDAMSFEMINGTVAESAYPYYSGANDKSNGAGQCASLTKTGYQIYGPIEFSNDTVALQNAVAMQPVVVLVDASSWSPYSGGIYSQCTSNVDHAVLLVGYTSQYWIIKNSWGAGWGESGFIRVANSAACNQMITTSNYAPLATPRTADIDPNCKYYASTYCTNPSYASYMMANCWVTCKFHL